MSAVQARSESSRGRTLATEASLAAFTLQGITIPRGRDRLGLSVRLRSTGMAIRREVVCSHGSAHPHPRICSSPSIPDRRRALRRVDSARLPRWAPTPGAPSAAKRSVRGGTHGRRREIRPTAIRRAMAKRDGACLEAAWFLISPPFAVGALSLLVAVGLAALAGASQWQQCCGGVRPARPGAANRSDPGTRQATHVARALRRAVVPDIEGRCPAAPLASVVRRNDYYGPTARV